MFEPAAADTLATRPASGERIRAGAPFAAAATMLDQLASARGQIDIWVSRVADVPQWVLAAQYDGVLSEDERRQHDKFVFEKDRRRYLVTRALVYIPVFGLYLTVSKQISIDRSNGRSALSQIIAQARPVLAAGRQIFIFPEGTRRPAGAPPAYKFGVAALYADTKAPVLPVALNTGLFWGRRGFLRRPGVAVIQFLPPIPPGLERPEFTNQLQSRIEKACDGLNVEAIEANPALSRVLEVGRNSGIVMPPKRPRSA